MITIQDGMTSAAFFAALAANNTELRTNWSVNSTSFDAVINGTTGVQAKINFEHNFRTSGLSIGSAIGLKNFLNNGFALTVHRFQDNSLENILSPETSYGEPTALVSDDGSQIDLWCFLTNRIYYTYSTDGLTFAAPSATNITVGYMRNHILKVGNIYYHYAVLNDDSMHLFTSTDKINFTDQGEVLHHGGVGDFDSKSIANMFVWKEGINWYMLYEAMNTVDNLFWTIGLATASAPEGPWTKYASNPVITSVIQGAGNPEIPRVNNEIIKHNGLYYVYFHQGDGLTAHIRRAYSSDLHTWTQEGIILDDRNIHDLGGVFYTNVD